MKKIRDKVGTVIIGGGIIGLSIAYYLTEFGYKDFVVLEQSLIGSGSSGRCGSGIRAQFADETNIEVMKASTKLWEELSVKLGFDFIQSGYLYLIYNQEELKQFEKMKKIQNSLGLPTRMISPDEINKINEYIDTSRVVAGSYNPEDGKTDPFDAIFSLMNYLNKSRVHILQHTKVTNIEISSNGVKKLGTNQGEIRTERLINATGGWAPKIGEIMGTDMPIKSYKHQAIITEPLKEGMIEPVVISLTHDDAYLTQTKDGGIIGGVGTPDREPPTYDTSETIDFQERVSKAFTQIMPSLRFVRILRSWGGYYAMTPDGNPMLGEYEIEGNYIAAGFSGHGFMMAPIVGRSMAELIVNGKSRIDLGYYDPARFERGELREAALQMG